MSVRVKVLWQRRRQRGTKRALSPVEFQGNLKNCYLDYFFTRLVSLTPYVCGPIQDANFAKFMLGILNKFRFCNTSFKKVRWYFCFDNNIDFSDTFRQVSLLELSFFQKVGLLLKKFLGSQFC